MALARGGRDTEFASDAGPVPAYRSHPAAKRGPGVLVVHEGDGLQDFTRDVCDRLAREGFLALAPDLYRGRTGSDPQETGRLVQELDLDRAAGDLDAGVSELLNSDAVVGGTVGVVGFCMGGALALWFGSRNSRVGAVADFYGFHPRVDSDLGSLGCPVLGVFGDADAFVPAEAVETLRARLDEAGVRASLRVEAGVGHGFMNEARADVYDTIAADAGWDALLAVLRAELE
jgi:carboxymethylenebutenolidase